MSKKITNVRKAIKYLGQRRECVSCHKLFDLDEFYDGRAKCKYCYALYQKMSVDKKIIMEDERYRILERKYELTLRELDDTREELAETRRQLDESRRKHEETRRQLYDITERFDTLIGLIEDSPLLRKELGFEEKIATPKPASKPVPKPSRR